MKYKQIETNTNNYGYHCDFEHNYGQLNVEQK